MPSSQEKEKTVPHSSFFHLFPFNGDKRNLLKETKTWMLGLLHCLWMLIPREVPRPRCSWCKKKNSKAWCTKFLHDLLPKHEPKRLPSPFYFTWHWYPIASLMSGYYHAPCLLSWHQFPIREEIVWCDLVLYKQAPASPINVMRVNPPGPPSSSIQ